MKFDNLFSGINTIPTAGASLRRQCGGPAAQGGTEGRASGPAWRLPPEEVVFLRAIPAIAAAAAVWMNA